MKPTELMIGDWVKWKDKYVQIVTISGIVYSFGHIDVEIAHCGSGLIERHDLKSISPIPLTPEILEKNGFKVDGYAILNLQDGKWLEYYFHEHRFSMYYEGIDEWQNHSQVRDIVHRSQPFYVHELQHALRLCGLNDLADNFKLEK